MVRKSSMARGLALLVLFILSAGTWAGEEGGEAAFADGEHVTALTVKDFHGKVMRAHHLWVVAFHDEGADSAKLAGEYAEAADVLRKYGVRVGAIDSDDSLARAGVRAAPHARCNARTDSVSRDCRGHPRKVDRYGVVHASKIMHRLHMVQSMNDEGFFWLNTDVWSPYLYSSVWCVRDV